MQGNYWLGGVNLFEFSIQVQHHYFVIFVFEKYIKVFIITLLVLPVLLVKEATKDYHATYGSAYEQLEHSE